MAKEKKEKNAEKVHFNEKPIIPTSEVIVCIYVCLCGHVIAAEKKTLVITLWTKWITLQSWKSYFVHGVMGNRPATTQICNKNEKPTSNTTQQHTHNG